MSHLSKGNILFNNETTQLRELLAYEFGRFVVHLVSHSLGISWRCVQHQQGLAPFWTFVTDDVNLIALKHIASRM